MYHRSLSGGEFKYTFELKTNMRTSDFYTDVVMSPDYFPTLRMILLCFGSYGF